MSATSGIFPTATFTLASYSWMNWSPNGQTSHYEGDMYFDTDEGTALLKYKPTGSLPQGFNINLAGLKQTDPQGGSLIITTTPELVLGINVEKPPKTISFATFMHFGRDIHLILLPVFTFTEDSLQALGPRIRHMNPVYWRNEADLSLLVLQQLIPAFHIVIFRPQTEKFQSSFHIEIHEHELERFFAMATLFPAFISE